MKLLVLWRKLLRDSLQQGGFHILANAYIMALGVSSIIEAYGGRSVRPWRLGIQRLGWYRVYLNQDYAEPAKSAPHSKAAFNDLKDGSLVITPPPQIIIPHSDAYLVGGSVRDLISGSAPLDYDIAVGRDPEAYAAKLARQLDSRVIQLGKYPFSVYRVVSGTIHVDVAAMNGSSIEADLEARDFTINALGCDLGSGQIVDTTGGLDALQQRKVRMVSTQGFAADPIRLVRAFRMAAIMNFDIERRTVEAIAYRAATIQKSAGERILNELHKTLACHDSHRQIVSMAQTGLLSAIFPELIPLKTCRPNRHHAEDAFNHTLSAYRQLEGILSRPQDMLSGPPAGEVATIGRQNRILLKLAILLHDIGKPDSHSVDGAGKTHFYGHAKRSAALLLPICRRLRMSNQDRDWLAFIVGHHQRPLELYLSANKGAGRTPSKAIGRFFRQCGDHAPALLLHALADNLGKVKRGRSNINAMHLFIVDLLGAYFGSIQSRRANPLINGDDLIQRFGLTPSPLFGSILGKIEEAYLAGSIQNRDQALDLIVDILHQPPAEDTAEGPVY